MTLMIILGIVAALYLALLLYRLAILALPISAGLIVASLLHDQGSGWTGAALAGLFAGCAAYLAGRICASDGVQMPVRVTVLLLFSSAAACAGYQLGSALAVLGGLEADWQRVFAVLTALATAHASWRNMLGSARTGGACQAVQGEGAEGVPKPPPA